MLNKGEWLRQREVYYISSGFHITKGRVTSLMPTEPGCVRIRKYGTIHLSQICLDLPSAYVAQNIALRKQKELVRLMLLANEANMLDY